MLSHGRGEERGVPISYQAQSPVLGLVLPSNSPGVHTLWLPIIPMQVGLVLKPGPAGAVDAVPHGRGLLRRRHPARGDLDLSRARRTSARPCWTRCPRSLIFGGTATVDRYRGNPRVQAHGPGFSKILLGDDVVDQWERYLDVMVESVFINSGRSCINTSGIWASRHTKEIAEALAARLATVEALPPDDPQRRPGGVHGAGRGRGDLAVDRRRPQAPMASRTSRRRIARDARVVKQGRADYLLPTVVHCESPEAAIAKKEYMFPFVTVVECPEAKMIDAIGPTLVCTAITGSPSSSGACSTPCTSIG